MEKLNLEFGHSLAKAIESARQVTDEEYGNILTKSEVMAIAERIAIPQIAAIKRGARLDPHLDIFKEMLEQTESSEDYQSAIDILNNLDK
jgi:hypothetical protein